MLKSDEKWHIVPAGLTTTYGLSIRSRDGAFREPTREEVEDLCTCQARAAALASSLADALSMLRFFVTTCEVAMPEESAIAVDKMKALGEILQRSGYLT